MLSSAVESCMSFQVRKSFKTKTIEMYRRERKCLHHYVYLIDPEFGFMHIRIQGWIPYDCPDLHQRARVVGPSAG